MKKSKIPLRRQNRFIVRRGVKVCSGSAQCPASCAFLIIPKKERKRVFNCKTKGRLERVFIVSFVVISCGISWFNNKVLIFSFYFLFPPLLGLSGRAVGSLGWCARDDDGEECSAKKKTHETRSTWREHVTHHVKISGNYCSKMGKIVLLRSRERAQTRSWEYPMMMKLDFR